MKTMMNDYDQKIASLYTELTTSLYQSKDKLTNFFSKQNPSECFIGLHIAYANEQQEWIVEPHLIYCDGAKSDTEVIIIEHTELNILSINKTFKENGSIVFKGKTLADTLLDAIHSMSKVTKYIQEHCN